jgi:hypothetical protein
MESARQNGLGGLPSVDTSGTTPVRPGTDPAVWRA